MNKEFVYCAKDGYNYIAKYYDKWKWQRFWTLNELPILNKWGETLPIGYGLDAGTGSGNNLNYFLSKGHKITAVDISPAMLNLCHDKYIDYVTKGQLNCEELDIQNLLTYRRKFDWITCNRVLSHIQNSKSVFRIFSNILKNHGQCFISDIHPNHNYSNTGLTIGNKKILIETYKHSINELRRIIIECNFEILEYNEIGFEGLDNKTNVSEFKELATQSTPIFFYFITRLKK